MTEPAGTAFRAQEVVDHYRFRPPYPPSVYEDIVARAPSKGCLVDLGCGDGKVARPMTGAFDRVVAVDPSANMLQLGKSLPNGDAGNITWVEATAEEARLPDAIDMVTFASSIHWMDPAKLFARLRKHVSAEHVLVIIQGDEPFEPAWQSDWRAFLSRWVPDLTGQPLDSADWVGSRHRYLDYVEVIHRSDHLSEPMRQSLEDFVLCQHSRDTFAIFKLGSRLARFQDELTGILKPHVDRDGQLEFRVKTRVTLGRLTRA